MEEFTAPKTGNYKLECWGAASHPANYGSGNTGYAYGGYSIGKIALNKSDIIYVVVGGAGAANNGVYGGNGGYNGGGRGGNGLSYSFGASGGGGATNITTTNRGELKNFASYRNEVLIVAGGAGGVGINTNPTGVGGGANGGSVNSAGWPGHVSSVVLQGATQTNGNAFGIGANASNKSAGGWCGDEGNGGGGGGFYGGYAYNVNSDGSDCSGSGGSGYVNKDIIIDGDTQAGVQSPEGYDGCCIVTWFLE